MATTTRRRVPTKTVHRRKAAPKTQLNTNRFGLPLNVRSYPKQALTTHAVPTFSTPLTTTVTTGLVSGVFQFNPSSSITSWATRFQAVYEEYRIVRIRAQCDFSGSTIPGHMLAYWDEKNNTLPSNTSASIRSLSRYQMSSVKPMVILWTAKDLIDLNYTPTDAATYDPVWLKVYTDNVNNGAPIAATLVMVWSFQITIQFRGLDTVSGAVTILTGSTKNNMYHDHLNPPVFKEKHPSYGARRNSM